MHIKPTAFNCAASGCDGFVRRVLFGVWIVDVCADCALRINSLKTCPRADPYPDPEPPKRRNRTQTKEEMKREIQKSKMMQAAKRESYQEKITRLNKEYKK